MFSPLQLAARMAPTGVPIARGAIRAGLGQIFGPPPFDPATDPGDPGLFGPNSASWSIVGEPAAIVGGVRSLLVQVLHPLAVAGVADHSSFRGDSIGRLHRTSAYVTTVTFGSTRDAFRVTRRVRSAHRPVFGHAPDGRPYSTADPELLAVVSVALTASMLVSDRTYAPRPVSREGADAFVAEQSRAAALLDPRVDLDELEHNPRALAAFRAGRLPLPMITEGVLPTSVAQLDETVIHIRRQHAVTEQTRELLRFLLWPQLPPAVRVAYLPMLAGALATMDRADLRLLGAPPLPISTQLAKTQTRAALTALRVAAGFSPSQQAATARATAR